jgi:hypothetical protein
MRTETKSSLLRLVVESRKSTCSNTREAARVVWRDLLCDGRSGIPMPVSLDEEEPTAEKSEEKPKKKVAEAQKTEPAKEQSVKWRPKRS